ncbi:MAG: VWA domain-containing protein [Deltaproteobacteria bacterium]|nr:VWA domain-containing protein [Deltaproteobacteria bacterium]MBW2070298.1 VWA domain-containing protein [Deltaproteobacteria bacterium]
MTLDWGRRFDIGPPLVVKSQSRARRQEKRLPRGRRPRQAAITAGGRYIKSRLPLGRPQSIALDASLRAAAGRQCSRQTRRLIRIATQDIREKVRLQATAATILFLVDASGSMGANRRMTFTKGIVFSLLTDAYHKRDQVALLAFRAAQTELILPFTRSPLVARKHLRKLSVGGKTPLGLGLKEAVVLLRRQQRKNAQLRPVLVVVSDGRGNVALEYSDPYDEAMHYASVVKSAGIESIFVDTEEDPCSFGYGPQLARAMGASYISAEKIRLHGVIELPL